MNTFSAPSLRSGRVRSDLCLKIPMHLSVLSSKNVDQVDRVRRRDHPAGTQDFRPARFWHEDRVLRLSCQPKGVQIQSFLRERTPSCCQVSDIAVCLLATIRLGAISPSPHFDEIIANRLRRYLVKYLKYLVIFNHAMDLDIETAGRSLEHRLLISSMRRPRCFLAILALLPARDRSIQYRLVEKRPPPALVCD